MTVEEAIADAEAILPGRAAAEGRIDRRWQAIIDVGKFIESNPEQVWAFIRRWGRHRSQDLRMAVATCLLEHLLEYHFSGYFPHVENEVRSEPLFADTYSMCSKFGQSELGENSRKCDGLKA